MTVEMKKEAETMCGIGHAIARKNLEKGMEQGLEKGRLESRQEGRQEEQESTLLPC